MIQKRMVFSGMVQGVGFRYTACRIANGYEVTGHVRNLPDGRVECLAEGRGSEVDAFLAEVQHAMAHYIRGTAEQSAPASGRWHSFGVAY